MDRVEKIKQALWDQQVDRDSSTGKLNFLFEAAEQESAQGPLREWPPSSPS